MTIITTEIQKWKRNKIVWCILALTLLLGAFAIERACSISRSSPFMDSFGDLYTLAFKNLSSLFLPIVLGMFATTLFFDEHKNDTMKELLPVLTDLGSHRPEVEKAQRAAPAGCRLLTFPHRTSGKGRHIHALSQRRFSMTQAVTYERETKSVAFQGKIIVLESLTPVLPPKEKAQRKKEIERCLYEVFRKYGDRFP